MTSLSGLKTFSMFIYKFSVSKAVFIQNYSQYLIFMAYKCNSDKNDVTKIIFRNFANINTSLNFSKIIH